ncbi:MAG TPA: sulfite exporter TauE/SafE family protein [Chloroflexota bacterium]|nr:sulfite exporter TauE/SafE family protein [Chloroflexota bacterium]
MTATLPVFLLLFVAAFLGGALNSVAGGGSFLTFPSLIVSGVPPINANATSSVALWPGTIASVSAYRREFARLQRSLIVVMALVSFVGGFLGAILLLHTPQATFARMIPYLLLAATVLFAFGPSVTRYFRGRHPEGAGHARTSLALVAVLQLVIALYGGFFGGGIGILMLATLGLTGMENIHEMNALKTLLASCINGMAVVTFVVAGAVFWTQAVVMIVGAIIGGYGGAYYARKLNPSLVRTFVICVGVAMTAYFFVRAA